MKTHPSETRPIRDFIIPICELVPTQDGTSLSKETSRLCGTCFLIGEQGFAITAAHVIEQTTDEFRSGMIVVGNEKQNTYYKIKVKLYEKHPTEDIAIIQFENFPDGKRISYFKISKEKEFSSLDYHMWGYPISIAEEIKYHNNPSHFLTFRPDLAFFKGYIRRRMPFSPNPSLEMYKGSVFYEINEIGGECFSGSPVLKMGRDPWSVFAIYVGEETSGRKCGYALSLESVADWAPSILGCSIYDEALRSGSI